MKNLLKPIIVLTAIAFFCTALLAGVNSLTKEKIKAAAEEKNNAAMRVLFPEEKAFALVDADEELLKKYSVSKISQAEKSKGYVYETSTSGYGGEILMMIAFSNNGDILGVQVLSHEETKGIGTRVVESEEFLSQFKGMNAQKEAGLDAVSGATVSSGAVLTGINNACNLFAELNKGGSGK